MSQINVNSPAFKSIYKVQMPNAKEVKDEKEKNVVSDAVINSVVMGFNMSVEPPRISKDKSAVFYKINDANDAAFEKGFKNIIENCNKQLSSDLAEKIYYEKASEQEFKNAEAAQ